MPATMIKVPGVGPVKSTYLYTGVVAAAAIVAYAYWRHYTNAQAATDQTATDQQPTDMAGTDPAAYDLGSGYDYSGSGSVAMPGSYPIYQSPNFTTPVYSGAPVSNPEWADAVQEKLTESGTDSQAIDAAIGRYLGHLCLTDAQADLIRRAIGRVGEPPQGSYTVTVCPPTGGTTPPPSTGGGTVVKPGAPGGLHAASVGKTSVRLDWNPVKGATHYHLYKDNHSSGYPAFSAVSVGSLQSRHTYHFAVAAVNKVGEGPKTYLTVRTH